MEEKQILIWWSEQPKVVKALLCNSVYGSGDLYDKVTDEQIKHIYTKCKL